MILPTVSVMAITCGILLIFIGILLIMVHQYSAFARADSKKLNDQYAKTFDLRLQLIAKENELKRLANRNADLEGLVSWLKRK